MYNEDNKSVMICMADALRGKSAERCHAVMIKGSVFVNGLLVNISCGKE